MIIPVKHNITDKVFFHVHIPLEKQVKIPVNIGPVDDKTVAILRFKYFKDKNERIIVIVPYIPRMNNNFF